MKLTEIQISELSFNPFEKLGKDWFLVTSGDENSYNTMTAAWGFFGFVWRKNVINALVRHNRYTFEFMEKNDLFTVTFLPEDKKDALKFCGANSGRNCDKAKETGLTPLFIDGTTTFEEAELVFVCKKVYTQDFDSNLFLNAECRECNETETVHKQFIGEILKVYQAK